MKQPLVVITGPTASGKSGLALELAERYDGEIICADSRTIYRGMDIGTAKPTSDEQVRVPHHLLDMVNPGELFTVADFQAAAYGVIDDIRRRNKVPFLVGGTGLYIDAVALEYKWPKTVEFDERLNKLSVSDLQSMFKEQHIPLPTNALNKRHLLSALLRANGSGTRRRTPLKSTHVVAITTDMNELETRIRERATAMFQTGVVEEGRRLAERYGWDSEAMTGNIYPLVRRMEAGEITEAEAIDQFVIKDRQLAKRQLTWLKRHSFVQWHTLASAKAYIETILG